MSGKRSETVLLDLESDVTWRYDLSEMAAAIAAYVGATRRDRSALVVPPQVFVNLSQ
jgi:hypothetical protein